MAGDQLGRQPGLADARLADDQHRPQVPVPHTRQLLLQLTELELAAHEGQPPGVDQPRRRATRRGRGADRFEPVDRLTHPVSTPPRYPF